MPQITAGVVAVDSAKDMPSIAAHLADPENQPHDPAIARSEPELSDAWPPATVDGMRQAVNKVTAAALREYDAHTAADLATVAQHHNTADTAAPEQESRGSVHSGRRSDHALSVAGQDSIVSAAAEAAVQSAGPTTDRGHETLEPSMCTSPHLISDNEAERLFMRLDVDGNGSIGQEELIEPLQALGVPRAEIEAALAEMGDGEISLAEFKQLVQAGLVSMSDAAASEHASSTRTATNDAERESESVSMQTTPTKQRTLETQTSEFAAARDQHDIQSTLTKQRTLETQTSELSMDVLHTCTDMHIRHVCRHVLVIGVEVELADA